MQSEREPESGGDKHEKVRGLWSFFFLPPSYGFACPTFYGVDYAAINASRVVIVGVIQSAHVDQEKREYVFNVTVRTTLKGEERTSWTILTSYLGMGEPNLKGWSEMGKVYIGFDVIDDTRSVGRFRNFGFSPLGIVPATPDNLDKIKRDVREPSAW